MSIDQMSGESTGVLPWIGQSYANGGFEGKRVLILGESHYRPIEQKIQDFSMNVVKWHVYTKRVRVFTKVQKILAAIPVGKPVSDDQRSAFWESVAFDNYIQTSVGERSRIRPSPEMWEAAEKPFLQTLNTLKPEFLIVLGKELEKNVSPLIVGIEDIKCVYVKHPSAFGSKLAVAQATFQNVFSLKK